MLHGKSALRNKLGSAAAAMSLVVPAAVGGCSRKPVTPAAADPGIRFVDRSAEAGIRFRHTHGGYGKRLMAETTGSGCAWLDYDGDGWPDLVVINCAPLSPTAHDRPTLALYHNKKDGTFEDVTRGSGLDVVMYGQGVTSADYDGDGKPDLFITCIGANHLFHNEGNGRFRDVTPASGLADGDQRWRWHTGSAWLDYDHDGRPDLFVARYVHWTPQTDQFCGIPGGLKRYCPPWKYTGDHCALYRNLGGGHFQDVSAATGVSSLTGKWFQPLVIDDNADGWPDVLVTSDGTPTALFRNQQGKRFTDAAAESGIALSETGAAKAGMGIDAADWQNNGRESVLIGNFSGERLSFFQPDNTSLYTDMAGKLGLGESSLYSLTFGVAFLDADLDGWPDAFIGNGHIDDYIEKFEAQVTFREKPLLYHNLQGARFEELGSRAGPAFDEKLVVRGCAVADYDRDGKPDLLVTENNGPAHLFRNETAHPGHWLRVELPLQPHQPVADALVEVTAGNFHQRRRLRTGSGFLSQSERALTFGLGPTTSAEVSVTWPDGTKTVRTNVPADQPVSISPDAAAAGR